MDFNVGCGCHQRQLSLLPVKQLASASMWTASNAFELARGGAVAESVKLDAANKDNYFLGTSQMVVEYRMAEPTEDQIVQAMGKLVEQCDGVRRAFTGISTLKCGTTMIKSKAALQVLSFQRPLVLTHWCRCRVRTCNHRREQDPSYRGDNRHRRRQRQAFRPSSWPKCYSCRNSRRGTC
jgi:hypothetical protein